MAGLENTANIQRVDFVRRTYSMGNLFGRRVVLALAHPIYWKGDWFSHIRGNHNGDLYGSTETGCESALDTALGFIFIC